MLRHMCDCALDTQVDTHIHIHIDILAGSMHIGREQRDSLTSPTWQDEWISLLQYAVIHTRQFKTKEFVFLSYQTRCLSVQLPTLKS